MLSSGSSKPSGRLRLREGWLHTTSSSSSQKEVLTGGLWISSGLKAPSAPSEEKVIRASLFSTVCILRLQMCYLTFKNQDLNTFSV